ncbi:enoyl-CoA hydratase/isomerase family protein [Mycobacterium sp. CVI_P3]|uniref:Enoyl-CoA hydratase/isomerase family protein n=1 Tax=Mycobacterium pinniadriaticum TaxID=2994102 RepID=A0ABT3SAZ1_9MYCO|nr:enoyl-CoA hydratase/isomerase family protein [Mycobacterium pinniadriaticum]MCX2930068.1 enoyl-CoA hydratase/isomerase family protein [Mycobacterium pinniadriaticum]MCX2936283.1 enoyl-CoA hydratase/isomerase family protein [Mycobacterium pinniadriaticum]
MTVAPDQTTDTDVLVTSDGSVGIVTINRPHRLNAVTPEAGDRLAAAFERLEADPQIRAVVLTGAGRGFCAGADISGDVGNARDVLINTWNPLVQKMIGLEIPIIAALNGVAAGAGASLALACDLRVAATSARIQLSFTKIGLLPDAGLTWLLPRIVGLGRANELALLARDLHAPEALDWGLVNRVCDDGAALDIAIAMGRDIAALAGSVAAVKMAHRRTFDSTLVDQLVFEADTQGWLQQQPDFAESTQAFGEKRPPVRADRVPGRYR